MQPGFRRSSRGFSLAELLTVVAIIGLLSMISVPAFINFRASNTFKSTLRVFIDDVRFARQYAITHTVDVRIDINSTGTQTAKGYLFYSSPDNGTTWNNLTIPGANGNVKYFPQQVWVASTTSLPVVGSTAQIVYHPNGSVTLTAGAPNGQIMLASTWTKMMYDRYTILLSPSGQLTSTGSHS